MILNEKQNHIAYRCPHCSCAATGFVGTFALSADMLKLKCGCGGSEMTLTYTSDKKIRLSVPCIFCGKNHSYVVSQNVFFGSEPFLLTCPYTNIDICFVGSEKKLQNEIRRSDEQLNKILTDMGISSIKELGEMNVKEPSALPDSEIYDIIRYLVAELKEDGAIDCPCHSGNYDFEATEDGIRIFCRECGAEYVFRSESVSAAKEFLNCDRIDLK